MKLTPAELASILKSAPLSPNDKLMRSYLVAVYQLIHFLGKEWVDDNILAGKQNFFLIDKSRYRHETLSTLRIIEFSEMLYNFYEINGFQQYLIDLKSRHDIESCFAELSVGKMLKMRKIPFSFRVKTGKKGFDYDFDININELITAPAEVKCKLESHSLTENSVANSFVDMLKRQQLPKGPPCIVFVSIPPSKITKGDDIQPMPIADFDKELDAAIERATKRLFSKTTRVVEVFLFTTTYFELTNGQIVNWISAKNFANPRSAFASNYNTLLPGLAESELYKGREQWFQYHHFVN